MNEEPLEVKIIGYVNSAIPEPWRERGDYEQERKRNDRRAFWLFVFQIIALVVAMVSMVATWLSASAALQQLAECKQMSPFSEYQELFERNTQTLRKLASEKTSPPNQ